MVKGIFGPQTLFLASRDLTRAAARPGNRFSKQMRSASPEIVIDPRLQEIDLLDGRRAHQVLRHYRLTSLSKHRRRLHNSVGLDGRAVLRDRENQDAYKVTALLHWDAVRFRGLKAERR